MKLMLSKADILLFIIIVVIAVSGIILLSGSGSAQSAVIRMNGQVVREVKLDVNQSFWVGNVRFEVKDGAITFAQSNCPGQECVHAGWLFSPGSSMACLPNKVSVTLTGESEVDVIAE